MAGLLLAAGAATPAPGQEPPPDPSTGADPAQQAPPAARKEPRTEQLIDPTNVDSPVFPADEIRYLDAFRLRLQSQFVPSSDYGIADVTLYRPNVRLQVLLPVSQRLVFQLSGRWEASRYEANTASDLIGLIPDVNDSLGNLYAFETDLQGAMLVNDGRTLFFDDEKWSVLADAYVGSRWEEGAFSEAVTYGGSVAFGYEVPRFRIGLGVRVGKQLVEDKVNISPVATFRWIPTNRITLRSRGLGLQLEYRINKKLELFVAGYSNDRRYLLRNRSGAAVATTLREDQILAGAGLEWRIARYLRLNLEGGAVAKQKLVLRLDDRQTLFSQRADPTGYFDIRIEIRP